MLLSSILIVLIVIEFTTIGSCVAYLWSMAYVMVSNFANAFLISLRWLPCNSKWASEWVIWQLQFFRVSFMDIYSIYCPPPFHRLLQFYCEDIILGILKGIEVGIIHPKVIENLSIGFHLSSAIVDVAGGYLRREWHISTMKEEIRRNI